MELDLQNPLTTHQDLQYDGVPSLFANESDHMPSLLSFHASGFRCSIRRTALSLISQVKFAYNLDPFLVYLSFNYVDRFLSTQEILKRPWIAHILVVASLSLAAKMRNSDLSISLSDLQREDGFEFDSQSVRRMERILLSTLRWRMRSITPFSFLQYFISLLEIEDHSLTQCLKHRASEIIFTVQQELKLLEYKPSTIAASALLCAIHDLTPPAFSSSHSAITSCEYVDKDTLSECFGVMQEMTREGYGLSLDESACATVTQISVLDTSVEGTSSSGPGFPESDNVKRRRLNGFYDNDRTFKISQIQQCN
ncbi:putative cyclin-D6-1 isoform X2 [Sesamum indicum]|uniref:Cyclin-D6-1 isoform X2 n=1 Tax=Sesamum indicum TaxID=4182 RepID=A0A8M8VBZ2_SESIN|nr:putative cyclin-D6-1 isoform X2 [Sesamum indicum]